MQVRGPAPKPRKAYWCLAAYSLVSFSLKRSGRKLSGSFQYSGSLQEASSERQAPTETAVRQ